MNSENREKNNERDYERISPTAWGVAYRRSLTDIPYAKELFTAFEEELERGNKSVTAKEYSTKGMPEITPFFEARYLMIDELLKKESATQILEIAAGLSGHGLEFSKNKDVKYVEMDLPGIIAEKELIVGQVLSQKDMPKPENLFFSAGNVLASQDMQKAVAHFDEEKKIAVTHEGLLRYLSFNEKEVLAQEIKSLLEKFGGVWITPDIGFRGRNATIARSANLAPLTGVADFEANLFADENRAKEFFERFGFTVESHDFDEVKNQLVSPERLNIPEEKLNELLNWNKAFVMRLQDHES